MFQAQIITSELTISLLVDPPSLRADRVLFYWVPVLLTVDSLFLAIGQLPDQA